MLLLHESHCSGQTDGEVIDVARHAKDQRLDVALCGYSVQPANSWTTLLGFHLHTSNTTKVTHGVNLLY